jgi:beta-lactamase superfamily II metal-dependent hydrolase
MTFRLTMHPAMDGDCLMLSWGRSSTLHHMIVDLGRGGTYRAVKNVLKGLSNVELFVMSHVDSDHIAGAIPLVRETTPPFTPKRVWYNARPHLIAAQNRQARIEPFGARQGEKLSRGIVKFNWPWNREFASEIVSVDSPEAAAPIALADGLTIRLLSPGDTQLIALLPVWEAELHKARISPFDPDEGEDPLSPRFEPFGVPNVPQLAAEDFVPDRTAPNGAAIAFVAEFEGKRVLLAADAHSDVMETALTRLAQAEGGKYRVDLLKISHHGSKANTSKVFPSLIDCTRLAVSTNGDRHSHPNPQTIARFLTADQTRDKTLYFNYRQADTDVWNNARLESTWKYACVFPVQHESDAGNGTLAVEV